MSSYWQYLSRPPPAHAMKTGFQAVEGFTLRLVLWSALFSWIFVNAQFVVKMYWPNWYHRLNERKRKELPSYLISTLHHLVMVPIAWTQVVADFQRSPSERGVVDYAIAHGWVAPISSGYIIADTVCFALPELAQGRTEFFLHHAFLLAFCAACMCAPGHILVYLPHFTICDTTNIIFNFAWLLRQTSWCNTVLLPALEAAFAAGFFILRNVHLTLVIAFMWVHGYDRILGLLLYLVLPLALLQFYWLYKIVQSVMRKKDKLT